MTPKRFRECLDAIGWTGRELARRLEVDERQARRWLGGSEMPQRVADWIEHLAQFHKANPAPPRVNTPRIEWDSEYPPPADRRLEIEAIVKESWTVRQLGASPALFEAEIVLHREGTVSAYGDNRGLVLSCEYHP